MKIMNKNINIRSNNCNRTMHAASLCLKPREKFFNFAKEFDKFQPQWIQWARKCEEDIEYSSIFQSMLIFKRVQAAPDRAVDSKQSCPCFLVGSADLFERTREAFYIFFSPSIF